MRSIVTLSFALAISFVVASQDCKTYYHLTDKAEIQMTTYDRKGKESGKMTWTVSDVKKDGSGFRSLVNSVFTDEKGKEAAKATGVYKCANGTLRADMRMSIPQEQMESYRKMDAKYDESYVEYPALLSAGQSLPDAELKMEMHQNGSLFTTITFKQSGRKVEGKESVTSPAGTWDAYKISSDGLFKAVVAGIGIPFNLKSTEWYVPGFGIVKSESYTKNGKLIGSTLITSIKK